MSDSISNQNFQRPLAVAVAVCGLATLTLLANHPGGGAQTFAELLKSEARDQFIAGIVHGGFIGTLGALIVCFVFLSRFLGAQRVPVVLGFVAFCIGSGMMMASMVLDGLVIPALAARYADVSAPEQLAAARTLFVLVGTLIRFLMPLALLFQAIATVSFSSVVVRRGGVARAAGIYGILLGATLCVALFAVPPAMADHVLLLGITLQAVWYLALSVTVYRSATTIAFETSTRAASQG